jgi:hypothetical protein
MLHNFSFRRFFKLVRREGAERYLFEVLISFALSVSLTRFYLSATGYPQLGGGELHIAHALWGGLLLFGAALLPLILSNRMIYNTSAIIAGMGIGLFIDEVGKFITKANDYFFPAAAPIVYSFFLISIVIYLRYTRPPNLDDHAELNRALEDIQEFLHHTFSTKHRAALEKRLSYIAQLESGAHARLALQLLDFVQSDERPVPVIRITRRRRVLNWISRRMTTGREKVLLIIGLTELGMVALKNPARVLLGRWISPSNPIEKILSITSGRHVGATVSVEMANIRVILELMIGTIFVVSVILLLLRQNKIGINLAFSGLFIYFTSANLLVFYFEQFSTMIMVAIQFAVLFCLIDYQRRIFAARRT